MPTWFFNWNWLGSWFYFQLDSNWIRMDWWIGSIYVCRLHVVPIIYTYILRLVFSSSIFHGHTYAGVHLSLLDVKFYGLPYCQTGQLLDIKWINKDTSHSLWWRKCISSFTSVSWFLFLVPRCWCHAHPCVQIIESNYRVSCFLYPTVLKWYKQMAI